MVKFRLKLFISIVVFILCLNSLNFTIVYSSDVSSNETWIQRVGKKEGDVSGGFNGSGNIATRGMEIYNGNLYVGTQNLYMPGIGRFNLNNLLNMVISIYHFFENIKMPSLMFRMINFLVPLHGTASKGGEVWQYNHSVDSWTPIVSDSNGSILSSGFGDSDNFAAAVLKEFKGDLYIGTATSSSKGCEIWRYNGTDLEKTTEGGFESRFNSGAWSIEVFKDQLYVGTMNWKDGCQIYRSIDGENWTRLQLPGGDGFGNRFNVYAWEMEVYNDSLYVGTCQLDEGGQLWRFDGSEWFKMILPGGDGFGEKRNYGIRTLNVHNGSLYVGVASNFFYSSGACEIWRYNDSGWFCLIGEKGNIDDGFGDNYNKYPWSMCSISDELWVGTLNFCPDKDEDSAFDSHGCQIWIYNNSSWQKIVGGNNDNLTDGGFGDRYNVGARSMIEYPKDSGNIWVGTAYVDIDDFKNFSGCQIWQKI